jgi:hypothetical protein
MKTLDRNFVEHANNLDRLRIESLQFVTRKYSNPKNPIRIALERQIESIRYSITARTKQSA